MLERDNPKPLYLQLRDILVEEIESGEWPPNSKIPSENELSTMHGLSRMTTRSVLSDLVKEGLLYRVQGKGTYVSEKIVTTSPYYVGVREQLERMGYEVNTKVIERGVVKCPDSIAVKLNLSKGMLVYQIKRVRYIKGKPISIHVSYVNSQYGEGLEKIDLEEEQLCVALNREYGIKRKKMTETLESIVASEREAEDLEVEKGHPLLLLKDILFDENNVPYEFTKVIFRGDKIKISLQFEQ